MEAIDQRNRIHGQLDINIHIQKPEGEKKARPLSTMNIKSIDINLLYASFLI